MRTLNSAIAMQQVAPPAPPAPPQIPVVPGNQGFVVNTPGAQVTIAGMDPSPNEVYQAVREQRNELRSQLGRVEDTRLAIARRLREGEVSGPDRAGLEARLTQLDGRMSVLESEIAVADAAVAKAAAIPGAVQLEPNFMQNDAPQAAFVLGAIFLVVVLLPISVAFARRIWRRSSRAPATADVSHELDERFTRLEQGMDAIAVEVERVGESQRFMTRVFTEER
ncbi:MAG: hypothetical protein ABIZ91_09435, partial [Gemmatimonadaceae bacterium]